MPKKKTRLPPEGYKKHPWAIRGIDPPEEFEYEDLDEGQRAAKAARAWASRNGKLGLRVAVRKSPTGMTVYFVRKGR